MENSKQSAIFQLGEEIEWEDVDPGIKRRVYGYNEQLMMVRITFERGAMGVLHQHQHSQVSYIESGVYELTIGDTKRTLKQGDGYFVPPNTVHGLICIQPGVLVEAFTPCREDFLTGV